MPISTHILTQIFVSLHALLVFRLLITACLAVPSLSDIHFLPCCVCDIVCFSVFISPCWTVCLIFCWCVQCSCQLYVYGEACPFGFPSVSLSACLSVYLTFYRSCHQSLGLVSVPFCNHPNSALRIMTSASLTAIVILGKSAAVTPALQDVSTQRLVMLVLVS